MRIDINDRPQRKASHATWRPFVAAIAVATLLSSGMIYLYSTGWGVTVDLQKLKEAFVVNGKAEPESWNDELARGHTTITAAPQSEISQRTSLQPKNEQAQKYYVHPKGMPPIDWDVHIQKFNSVFTQHPACNPHNMQWTQMECSNFRARAMKRFGIEWNKGAYWDGYKITKNKDADERVNSEIGW